MFKVNNRNTRTRCRICSKLTIKTPERRYWRRSGVFIVNFKQISHLALVFLLLTLSRYTPAGRWPLGLQIPKNPRLNRVKRMSQVIESHSNTAASFRNVLLDTWWDFFPKNVEFYFKKPNSESLYNSYWDLVNWSFSLFWLFSFSRDVLVIIWVFL